VSGAAVLAAEAVGIVVENDEDNHALLLGALAEAGRVVGAGHNLTVVQCPGVPGVHG